MDHLFTPFMKGDKKRQRVFMSLNEADHAKIKRGHKWSAVVTDINTGRVYHVRGASCGSPSCFCAASAEEVK